MKKIKIYVTLITLGLLVVAQIVYTIGMATSGAEVTKLEKEASALAAQNQAYQEEMMTKSSLTEIEAKATELGFSKPTNIVYVAGESAVAAKLP